MMPPVNDPNADRKNELGRRAAKKLSQKHVKKLKRMEASRQEMMREAIRLKIKGAKSALREAGDILDHYTRISEQVIYYSGPGYANPRDLEENYRKAVQKAGKLMDQAAKKLDPDGLMFS